MRWSIASRLLVGRPTDRAGGGRTGAATPGGGNAQPSSTARQSGKLSSILSGV
jgi:hypothetical protein